MMRIRSKLDKICYLCIAIYLGSLCQAQESAVTKLHASHSAAMNHNVSKDGPQVTVKTLRADKYANDIDGEKTTATMVEVVLDPLAGSPPHRHPGPVSGYVLEGTFEFQVEGSPLKVLKAGDNFFEPRMILHMVGRNPDKSKRTRVLATIVHPSAASSIMIMEPVKANQRERKEQP
jgi:quercetin dioxygenase-like cupin family protein